MSEGKSAATPQRSEAEFNFGQLVADLTSEIDEKICAMGRGEIRFMPADLTKLVAAHLAPICDWVKVAGSVAAPKAQPGTRQQRLSEACENCAGQIGSAVRLNGGAVDESQIADLIYAWMRDLFHEVGEACAPKAQPDTGTPTLNSQIARHEAIEAAPEHKTHTVWRQRVDTWKDLETGAYIAILPEHLTQGTTEERAIEAAKSTMKFYAKLTEHEGNWPEAGAPKAGEPPQNEVPREFPALRLIRSAEIDGEMEQLSNADLAEKLLSLWAHTDILSAESSVLSEAIDRLRGAGETPAERPQPEKKAICMCGHKARSHGPNWNGESPEKEATGFPVCHYPGCKCMAYCAPLPPGAAKEKP